MAAHWLQRGFLIICGISAAHSFLTIYPQGCAGKAINTNETACPMNTIIEIQSLSIYATENSSAIENSNRACLGVSQCKRIIHNVDPGLSFSQLHLFKWFLSKCEGRHRCEGGKLPEWWELIGDITSDASQTRTCPAGGTKYFAGVLLHIECVGGNESTVLPPLETSPRTKPTTPTTTTAFAVYIPVYLPTLEEREKLILALAIGLAIAIIIMLLVILYCCERYRNHKKFGKLLRMLGAPQEQNNDDDYEDYTKTENWTNEHINPDALGEYTGVKPNEFMTLSQHEMEKSGQIMYDSAFGTMNTARRGNSCSTLSRGGGGGYGRHPSMETGLNGYNGPMAYDTEENMELERRMAAVLDENWQPPTSPGAESHIGESVTSFTNSSDSDPGVETAGEGGDRAGYGESTCI